jgi:hypothetical protein
MAELTLISSHPTLLQPLLQDAILNEVRLLNLGIQRTQQRLAAFEAKYHFSTEDFIRRYEDDQIAESLEFAEWVGEHRMLERLQEKVNTLQGVKFAR